MIDAKMIPAEVEEAIVRLRYDETLSPEERIRAAFAAGLAAWPGAYGVSGDPYRADETEYRLPLTQEPGNG